MPLLTKQAYDAQIANKPTGYVPPDKRTAAPATFEEAFPTLGAAPKKAVAKWGAPKPAPVDAAPVDAAAPVDPAPSVDAAVPVKPASIWGSSKIKEIISGTLAVPVVSTVEPAPPKYTGARVRIIDVSTVESASRDLAKYGDLSGNEAFLDNIRDRIVAETREHAMLDEYYKTCLPNFKRYHELQRQRIAEQNKKRWIFDQSSSEEEIVPEDDVSEMYSSEGDDEGEEGGNEINEENEYEFRR